MSKLYTLALLILNFTAVNVSDRENTYYKLCSPFNALLILPESNWEAPVTQQRRFLIRLIEAFPSGTHISVRIVGDEEKKYEFVKDGQNFDDVGTINQLIVKSPNNMIKYKAVSNWISTSFDKNKSPKSAEKIFFIVNDHTEVDDVKKVLEVIKNKDRYVVLYGEHSIGDDWTYVALDVKNIHVLGKSEPDIEKTVQVVKTQSCLDNLKHQDNQQKGNSISESISNIQLQATVNTIIIGLVLVPGFVIFILRKKFILEWLLRCWQRLKDLHRRQSKKDESGVKETDAMFSYSVKVEDDDEEKQGENRRQNPNEEEDVFHSVNNVPDSPTPEDSPTLSELPTPVL